MIGKDCLWNQVYLRLCARLHIPSKSLAQLFQYSAAASTPMYLLMQICRAIPFLRERFRVNSTLQ